MPRCELTKAAVGRIKRTAHIKRTIYMDTDIPVFYWNIALMGRVHGTFEYEKT